MGNCIQSFIYEKPYKIQGRCEKCKEFTSNFYIYSGKYYYKCKACSNEGIPFFIKSIR